MIISVPAPRTTMTNREIKLINMIRKGLNLLNMYNHLPLYKIYID
ncbi:hypothetical protein BACI349Y_580112 [Bacillus sp. 349Y]|nr:hypothetical protein BACI349Y_580112 [Bacillus sp. 349Y]